MREIEIKLKVADPQALRNRLTDLGCQLSEPIRQEDTVYSLGRATNGWEKPKEGDVIVRIRRQNDHTELTAKQQRTNELDNTECEMTIEDPDTMHQIIGLMGWAPVIEVKKNRQKGKLNDFNICLDSVDLLGDFMEIEKLADDEADVVEIEKELLKTAESLGLSSTDRVTSGYDTLIYHLNH